MIAGLPERIFKASDNHSFNELALEVFKFQLEKNEVYRFFVESLGKSQSSVNDITEIPFLPAEVFKNRKVITGDLKAEVVFESSRTTSSAPGRHYVHDLKIYEESFLKSFKIFYGDPSEYFIGALLPSYTRRPGSSLVYMMNGLIKQSRNGMSGFYDERPAELIKSLHEAKLSGWKTFLIGVSFALLDLANEFKPDLSGTIVMETGGMKGRRKEITREELHRILMEGLNVKQIHSEYGMTELLSQAYSGGDGIFYCPPWMKILLRDPRDPFSLTDKPGKSGAINIVDLANLYSCSFIATSDYGVLHEDGGFEVIGRLDNSDIRGCNLMTE